VSIDIAKSDAHDLPIDGNGRAAIELIINQRVWLATLHQTQRCKYVWISQAVADIHGNKDHLANALGNNYKPNDRVVLRTRFGTRQVKVL
jgi:hypothetical protein